MESSLLGHDGRITSPARLPVANDDPVAPALASIVRRHQKDRVPILLLSGVDGHVGNKETPIRPQRNVGRKGRHPSADRRAPLSIRFQFARSVECDGDDHPLPWKRARRARLRPGQKPCCGASRSLDHPEKQRFARGATRIASVRAPGIVDGIGKAPGPVCSVRNALSPNHVLRTTGANHDDRL